MIAGHVQDWNDGSDATPEDWYYHEPLIDDRQGWVAGHEENGESDDGFASTVEHDAAPRPPTIGDPDHDVAFWHAQDSSKSCAVASQEDMLEQVTGRPFDESQLSAEATAHGWYDPGQGTPLSRVGDLVDAHGVPTVRGESSMAELLDLAQRDVPIIVSVDSTELWSATGGNSALADSPAVDGVGADHVVVVTGVDVSDPASPQIVVNDSGRPDGAGLRVDLDRFEAAWADSGHYAVYPGTPEAPMPPTSLPDLADHVGEPMVGTSYTVPGSTEEGDVVSWSTSSNTYNNQRTGAEVEEK